MFQSVNKLLDKKHKMFYLQFIGCNPSLQKPQDPKLIWKDIIYILF